MRAIALALLVTVLWSSSWVLIRWGLDDHGLQPIGFAGVRYGVAAASLIGLVTVRPKLRRAVRSLTAADWGRLAVLGLVFYTLTQGAQFVAIANQPAATTSLVLSATPLIVLIASGRFLGEGPAAGQFVGSGLIALGAAAYFAGDLGFTTIGITAALVCLGANVVSALLGRSVNRSLDLPAEAVTATSMAIGAAVLLGVGAATEGLPRLDPAGWGIVVWLALVNTALAFTLWNWSLRHLTATASAAINNMMLIQIALLGWVFLDERPGPSQWVGIAAVTLGVALAQGLFRGGVRGR